MHRHSSTTTLCLILLKARDIIIFTKFLKNLKFYEHFLWSPSSQLNFSSHTKTVPPLFKTTTLLLHSHSYSWKELGCSRPPVAQTSFKCYQEWPDHRRWAVLCCCECCWNASCICTNAATCTTGTIEWCRWTGVAQVHREWIAKFEGWYIWKCISLPPSAVITPYCKWTYSVPGSPMDSHFVAPVNPWEVTRLAFWDNQNHYQIGHGLK